MSKLEALIGKAKTFEIEGIPFTIEPETAEFIESIPTNEKKSKKFIFTRIDNIIKENYPDVTDAELDTLMAVKLILLKQFNIVNKLNIVKDE